MSMVTNPFAASLLESNFEARLSGYLHVKVVCPEETRIWAKRDYVIAVPSLRIACNTAKDIVSVVEEESHAVAVAI
jgi:hypothetical protein